MSEHTAPPTMAFAEYCALPGVNWSLLKWMAVSPKHYRHARDNRLNIETDPMRLGRAVHSLVFEPETYGDLYTIYDGIKRGKAWDAFLAEHAHLTILKPAQDARARAMAAAVRAHPAAQYWLERGHAERTIVWTDERYGVIRKSRLDFLATTRHAIVDLKSMNNLDERAVANTIAKYGYHGQLSFYRDGAMETGLWVTPPRCIIIGVESKAPFDVGVFELDSVTMDRGAEMVEELLGKVAACEKVGDWPGRYPDLTMMQVPDWALGDLMPEEEEASDE